MRKAAEALRWHFGIVTDPPSNRVGREYLARFLPECYRIKGDVLIVLKTNQPAEVRELATNMGKAWKLFHSAQTKFKKSSTPISQRNEEHGAAAREANTPSQFSGPSEQAQETPGISTGGAYHAGAEETFVQTMITANNEPETTRTEPIVLEQSESDRQAILARKSQDFQYHLTFLSAHTRKVSNADSSLKRYIKKVKLAPLFSGKILDRLEDNTFDQYGLLGEHISPSSQHQSKEDGQSVPSREEDPRLFLNVSTPWSAFICGSQGSGKSHTLSCMLENCLIKSRLGRLDSPLKGIVFHYDAFTSYRSNQVCEAAYLCSSGIPVRVLVSPSNYHTMKQAYGNLPHLPSNTPRPEVIKMLFQDRHLDVGKMMSLMAVNNKEGAQPLYIEAILRILREMARESHNPPSFDYNVFRKKIDDESFTGQQLAPLKLRLDLLESFLDRPPKAEGMGRFPKSEETKAGKGKQRENLEVFNRQQTDDRASRDRGWSFEPGTLTIVDLSCPFVDESAACSLFNICLELFLESRGKLDSQIVALDEAHKVLDIRPSLTLPFTLPLLINVKFMTSSASATVFTETLLQVIRQQRHLATRVVIATQEPTISPKLLDLSTMTIVHRFTSPEWFRVLRDHLAGMSSRGETEKTEAEGRRDVSGLFEEIVRLETGEALLFSPAAMLDKKAGAGGGKSKVTPDEEVFRDNLGTDWAQIKVRQRLTEDGGRSIVAV